MFHILNIHHLIFFFFFCFFKGVKKSFYYKPREADDSSEWNFCLSEDWLSTEILIWNHEWHFSSLDAVQRVCNGAAFLHVALCGWVSQNPKKINADILLTVCGTTESMCRLKQNAIPRQLRAALFCSQDSIWRCEWIVSQALSPVLRIPSHTPRTLYPPDMCALLHFYHNAQEMTSSAWMAAGAEGWTSQL